MELEIRIKDDVSTLLGKMSARMNDLTPAMELIGEVVVASIQQNFKEGGRPEKWKALSPVTIKQRQAENKWPGAILVRTGHLRQVYSRAEKDKVSVGTNLIYAKTHQFGARKGSFGSVTARVKEHFRRMKDGKEIRVKAHDRTQSLPWGDIPARPFLMVQDEDWVEMKAVLEEYLYGLS